MVNISEQAKNLLALARRQEEIQDEIQKLCSRLGELTQEHFVITTGIQTLTEEIQNESPRYIVPSSVPGGFLSHHPGGLKNAFLP